MYVCRKRCACCLSVSWMPKRTLGYVREHCPGKWSLKFSYLLAQMEASLGTPWVLREEAQSVTCRTRPATLQDRTFLMPLEGGMGGALVMEWTRCFLLDCQEMLDMYLEVTGANARSSGCRSRGLRMHLFKSFCSHNLLKVSPETPHEYGRFRYWGRNSAWPCLDDAGPSASTESWPQSH